jgi:predicted methyltransferase
LGTAFGAGSFFGLEAFFSAGLAEPAAALGAGAALGFLGITVNASSFPQWGHFAMVFLLNFGEIVHFNIGIRALIL